VYVAAMKTKMLEWSRRLTRARGRSPKGARWYTELVEYRMMRLDPNIPPPTVARGESATSNRMSSAKGATMAAARCE